MASIGFIVISFLARNPQQVVDSRLVVLLSMVTTLVIVSFTRLIVFRNLFLIFAKNEIIRRRVLIVGAGKSGKIVAANLLTDKKYGLELVGFVDDHIATGTKVYQSYLVLGNMDDIKELVRIYAINEIIVCLSNTTHDRLMEVVEKCKTTGRQVQVYSELYEIVSQKMPVERYSDFPMVSAGRSYEDGFNTILKRAFDIVGSLIGFIVFSPFFLILALLIKLDSPGPVFFRQVRLGKDGKKFTFFKFRSMFMDNDDKLHREYLKQYINNGKGADNGGSEGVYKIVDDPRVTRIGKFLRSTSLDELPQFINVLKGDMSLVGPRPCLPYEYEEYNPWHKKRMRVLPGLTGLWQVSGRSSVVFDDMVVLDLYYIENMSPWFDLQIVLKTIPVILFKRGAH